MKKMSQFLVVLGVLALIPGFAAQAQTSPSTLHQDRTIWIDPPLDSLLGGGYVSTYLTDIRARTIASETLALRQAIDTLDGLGMKSVNGFGLVPVAVSAQTKIPLRTLIQQQADSRLSYAELLMANLLATKSGTTFGQVLLMRSNTQTWGQVMKQIGIDQDIVITRADAASEAINYADIEHNLRRRQRLAQNFQQIH